MKRTTSRMHRNRPIVNSFVANREVMEPRLTVLIWTGLIRRYYVPLESPAVGYRFSYPRLGVNELSVAIAPSARAASRRNHPPLYPVPSGVTRQNGRLGKWQEQVQAGSSEDPARPAAMLN